MVAGVAQILGKINPKKYADNWKSLLQKYKSPANIPADEVKEKPLSEHKMVYDSSSETLEPIYFFILDLMTDFKYDVEKIIDNFSSSPGSGHFAELGQRATVMQQQGAKILGDVNTVLRSVLNIIYDLKEFRIRLSQYDDLKTEKKEVAVLALKQVWIDKVDINKGNSSIKAMALGQAGFQTLIDAFLFAKDVKDVDKIDLNDRVKRILRPRILEFKDWLENSEKELRKRYELEKNYLQSQVNSLKLYARWAKPYLKAAQQLEQRLSPSAALVNSFNTAMFELVLLIEGDYKTEDDVNTGDLPPMFKKIKGRKYKTVLIVELKFRSAPERNQQGYGFRGKVEIGFTSYSLNDDELRVLREEIEKDDLGDTLKLIEGATDESLSKIQEEIDSFLNEGKKKDAENGQKSSNENPFSALFSMFKSKKEDKKPGEKSNKIAPDSSMEKVLRSQAIIKAREQCAKIYGLYKSAHNMPNF